MIEYERSVPDSDELGPGSDLVISMFALAMLVMAIIGSGLAEPNLSKQEAVQNSEIAGLTARLRDAEQRLAKTLTSDQIDANDRELASLRQKLYAQETELEATKRAILKPGSIPDDVIFTARDGAGSAFFTVGSAAVSPEGRRTLIESLQRHASKVSSEHYNTLIVEGYASPDPPWNMRDNSTQLAFVRADAVANILIQAGIPRRCLGIMSYGRNRSELLFGQNGTIENMTEEYVRDFDKKYIHDGIEIPVDKLASERRIDVRAGVDPRNSFCSSDELVKSLRAAN